MDRNEFIKVLKGNRYSFKVDGGSIVITHDLNIYMSIKEIPGGLVFQSKGSVILISLNELPEGTVFENKGQVHMPNLTELPEGVVFNNGGPVDLPSVTELPEGAEFNNEGTVYLNSVTSLPEVVLFQNKSIVYLPSLMGVHFYLGEERLFETVDGFTMLIEHQKTVDGYTIKSARYFGGGLIEDMDHCYIAEKDGGSAHGSTVREAIEDLQFKLMERTGTKELVGTSRDPDV